jgi:hypothetical protein
MNPLEKMTSGRFILTIIAGMVFAWLSINGQLPLDKVTEIVLLVFMLYFTRSDRTNHIERKDEP